MTYSSWYQKTRFPELRDTQNRTIISFESTAVCDRRMDRQMDGQTYAPPIAIKKLTGSIRSLTTILSDSIE